MKRKLFNWLFPSVKKAEINAINWNFNCNSDNAPEALNIEKKDYNIVQEILKARGEDWLKEDEFADPVKVGADMKAECIFRGVEMTSGLYVLIVNTMFIINDERKRIGTLKAMKNAIFGNG